MQATARRLPGIGFQPQAPVLAQALPRMDVAGFVGFASSGPLDVPVPIDDPAQLADVFGPDAPLAWDATRGLMATAYLGPAVRAFFANGGRRCWVVRVADARRAATDTIALSGFAALDAAGALRPATLAARCPGSAADALRASTWVDPVPLQLRRAGTAFQATLDTPETIGRGDLLRVAPRAGWTTLMTVGELRAPGLFAPGVQRWVRDATPAIGATGHAHWLGPHGSDRVAGATVASAQDGRMRVALDVAVDDAPPPGALVRAVFGTRIFWVDVVTIEADGASTAIDGASREVRTSRPSGAALPPAGARAERLTLGLRVDAPDGRSWALGDLGLHEAHPRFAAGLPSDAALYGADADPAYPALLAAATQPRFPLAAPLPAPVALLPLGASIVPSAPLAAMAPTGSERRRDGLETFSTAVFTDPDLAGTSARTLGEQADWIRYASPQPRALRGIHALMAIDEVTIVAVPDALQLGWTAAAPAQAPTALPATPAPQAPPTTFAVCGARVPSTPVLAVEGAPASGAFTLTWTATDVAGATYELEEALDPGFTSGEPRYSGPDRNVTLYGRPDAPRIFRVRALAGGRVSGWSATVVVALAGAGRWVLADAGGYDVAPLRSLQAALLAMCATRGDMLAVLALPAHLRETEAIAHADALRAAAPDPVASFGALYHPWLYATDPARPGPASALPPDGPAAGVMAERALGAGPWIAPANVALRNAVALAPELAVTRHAALQAAQVNVVRRAPAGILVLAADTLAGDEALRPIGARRLLSMLRRMALEHGQIATFEPNDDVLARTLRRTFEGLLARVHERGGFAGTTAAESYAVWTGAPANSTATRDAGEVVVELRVAPSHPLAFLTVRVLRTGDGVVAVEAA